MIGMSTEYKAIKKYHYCEKMELHEYILFTLMESPATPTPFHHTHICLQHAFIEYDLFFT